jgi:hypothetical protein
MHGKTRNSHKILGRKLVERNKLDDRMIDERILLKYIFEN